MDDADLARLRRVLDLVTYMSPKPGVSDASQGVVQLDFRSGLFLEPGAGADEWVLEGRTSGDPPDSVIREWHVRAALAGRELDPTVQDPAVAAGRRGGARRDSRGARCQ